MKKLFLIGSFVILTLPVYFMVMGSLMPALMIMKMPPMVFPTKITFTNYTYLFHLNSIVVWFTNTLIVTFSTIILTVLLSSTSGYAFAFFKYRYKKIMWTTMLVGIMIPRIAMMIPTYVIIRKLGIPGSLLAVIIPIVYSPTGMYLSRTYFESIPYSLLESARLDGASELQILFKIVMPLAKPILTALALFSAINALSDFIWQMLVLQKEENQTLLVGLVREAMVRTSTDSSVGPIGKSLAVGVILLFPLVVVFMVANKYFTQSLAGAVKE